MIAFIYLYREQYGVEPICTVLPIASSLYYEHKRREQNAQLVPFRTQRDKELAEKVQIVWEDNKQVYGARKVWRQLQRESVAVARCTVERIMRSLGLRGVVRGKRVRTTCSAAAEVRPLDLVKRDFSAIRPNQLWAGRKLRLLLALATQVADFTYVATWVGVLYAAFVIDVFSRMIVG